MMVFIDRRDAGKQLAELLLAWKEKNPVVLALPRGGAPVAFEVAQALGAPLDLVLVRKIGAPSQEELAVGAVADGEDPEIVTDPLLVAALDISPTYLEKAKTAGLEEIERRRQAYLGERKPASVSDRTAIIIDDGIATGATMLAALRATRRRKPMQIVLAVPVAARDVLNRLHREADHVVCVHTPTDLGAVGQFYRRFPQLRDQEVIELLEQARAFALTTKPAGSDG
jgi:putative phosphoribosyl transferase